ncbi:(2,3-dihydroxybenzoyl)adenylate synthase [[Mycobacterium] fortunisiensis]|uniref:(2,3-dihydroxybenzoyl)adenylate synthase n=1 Tax=[Mycobacterium] fortunisiensis TaxID=2600579 RepID=UPI0035584F43
MTTPASTPDPDESAAHSPSMPGFVPFSSDRTEAYRSAGHWADQLLDTILRDAAAQWPDRIAIADAHGSYRYDELDALADRAAAGIAGLGINPGDRVLVQLPNSCEFAVALFGLLRAGVIPVMCLPGHRLTELTHFAEVSGAVGLLIADTAGGFDYREMARRLVQAHPGLKHVLVHGEHAEFRSWAEVARASSGVRPQFDCNPGTPALLLVSGGTTGAPKLIPRTHQDYVYNCTASAALCELTGDDVYLVALPAAHNFPLACPGLLGALSVGATTVFTTDPSPESAFATIDKHRVTAAALVPALAKLWAQACDWEPLAPKTLRLLQVGGAKLPAADAALVRGALTPGLQQVFGMAEGLLNYTRIGDPAEVIEGTQGRPLSADDEIRIVDEDGNEVPDGVEGELLVRGPYTINGYFNADAANERSFSPDGFYRSGDRVRRFADGPRAGYLEVTGRIKDVIVRGGENVSALDLEEHLLTHPSVCSAAAVALPDQFLGEKVCAVLVFDGAPATLADLHQHLEQRGVAAHARPDVLVPMPSLPTTAVGKIDKKAIIAALTG